MPCDDQATLHVVDSVPTLPDLRLLCAPSPSPPTLPSQLNADPQGQRTDPFPPVSRLCSRLCRLIPALIELPLDPSYSSCLDLLHKQCQTLSRGITRSAGLVCVAVITLLHANLILSYTTSVMSSSRRTARALVSLATKLHNVLFLPALPHSFSSLWKMQSRRGYARPCLIYIRDVIAYSMHEPRCRCRAKNPGSSAMNRMAMAIHQAPLSLSSGEYTIFLGARSGVLIL